MWKYPYLWTRMLRSLWATCGMSRRWSNEKTSGQVVGEDWSHKQQKVNELKWYRSPAWGYGKTRGSWRWKMNFKEAGYTCGHLEEVQMLKRFTKFTKLLNFIIFRFLKTCIGSFRSARKVRGNRITKQYTSPPFFHFFLSM